MQFLSSACYQWRWAWLCPIEKVPCLHPSPREDLIESEGGIAVRERSEDGKGDEDCQRKESDADIPHRNKNMRPKPRDRGEWEGQKGGGGGGERSIPLNKISIIKLQSDSDIRELRV